MDEQNKQDQNAQSLEQNESSSQADEDQTRAQKGGDAQSGAEDEPPRTNDEQTGQGTGARAGEYS